MDGDDANEASLMAERFRVAWRDLRRAGSSSAVRALLYKPDPPLDSAQADALDIVVSHAPVRMGDIAALLRVEPSTATRAIARLDERGLICRDHDPHDARAVLIIPSSTGADLHARVRARANQLLAEALSSFDRHDRQILTSLIERLVASVDAQCHAADAAACSARPV